MKFVVLKDRKVEVQPRLVVESAGAANGAHFKLDPQKPQLGELLELESRWNFLPLTACIKLACKKV
jgi:hypothetical protein